jgi:hypothetical protein
MNQVISSPSHESRALKAQRKSVGASLLDQQKGQARKKQWLRILLVLSILLGVGGTITALALTKPRTVVLPGKEYPILGRAHIAEGSPRPQYNSNPPSSGDHYATPANWGIYVSPLKDEQAVHNLEHGGIWITYKNQNDKQLVAELTGLAKRYQSKIVLSPRLDNTSLVSLVSWGWVQNLDGFDEEKILNFISAHKDKGPEYVPDMGL